MKFYFAPLEGITGHCFRSAHHRYFPVMDAYYMPFVAANRTLSFSGREKRDIDPANNAGLNAVPQILTSLPDAFLWAAGEMADRGYSEINLNLGCPAPTVVSHHRGAGLLRDPDTLDRFLNDIYEGMEARRLPLKLSVKTRVGYTHPDEFPALMDIFVKYPVYKLIIHPRVREEFYQGQLHRDTFAIAMEKAKCPVIWNGEIRSVEDAERTVSEFPGIEGIMIGRGLLINPGMITWMNGVSPDVSSVRRFHDELLAAYQEEYAGSGERPVLMKMKELVYWLGQGFENGELHVTKLRHAKTLPEYRIAAGKMFAEKMIV